MSNDFDGVDVFLGILLGIFIASAIWWLSTTNEPRDVRWCWEVVEHGWESTQAEKAECIADRLYYVEPRTKSN